MMATVKIQRITKVMVYYSEVNMDICTKINGNTSNRKSDGHLSHHH